MEYPDDLTLEQLRQDNDSFRHAAEIAEDISIFDDDVFYAPTCWRCHGTYLEPVGEPDPDGWQQTECEECGAENTIYVEGG